MAAHRESHETGNDRVKVWRLDGIVQEVGTPGSAQRVPTEKAIRDAITAAAGGITQLTGDVTAGPGSGSQAATIAANSVTDAKLRQGAATTVIGRSANSTGNVADIVASVNQQVLGRRANALGFTEIADFGYWSALTNGDPTSPELIFDANGDVISMWTAT